MLELWLPLAVAILMMFFTVAGGLFTIRLRDKMHLVLGFSAGTIIALVLLDLIPEAAQLSTGVYGLETILKVVIAGFVTYLFFDRIFAIHSHGHEHCESLCHIEGAGPAILCLHSLIDGLILGWSFNLSLALGVSVAVAVLAHKFSDGLNTAAVALKEGFPDKKTFAWVWVAAGAPALGMLISCFLRFDNSIMGLVLAFFGGLFLYLSASELIPESHHDHPAFWTILSTLAGIAFLWVVTGVMG